MHPRDIRRGGRRSALVALGIATTLGLSPAAPAVPIHHVRADGGQNAPAPFDEATGAPPGATSITGSTSGSGATRAWFASAGQGILRTSATVTTQGAGANPVGMRSIAQFTYDDLDFSAFDAAGNALVFVDVTLHLDLDVVFQVGGAGTALEDPGIVVSVDIPGAGFRSGSYSVGGTNLGFFSGYSPGLGGISQTLALDFTVSTAGLGKIELTLASTASSNRSGGVAVSDASNSLHFRTANAGTVFTARNAGTTLNVNSAQGGIVNNRYTLPAAVPEPSTLTLLALGLAGLGWRRRRGRG